MFSIATAADFFQKVKEDLAELEKKIDDAGRAMNCILSAYHLHEWVWARWLKARRPIVLRGVTVADKDDFIRWLEANCPHFPLLRELTNGTKHCAPVHSTEKIEGYGMGPYGVGPYGAAYLLIDLGEECQPANRYLVASSVLREIVSFWDGFFSKFGVS